MTIGDRGELKLGPVERAICGIVVAVTTSLLCYIAWKVTDLNERVARLESWREHSTNRTERTP